MFAIFFFWFLNFFRIHIFLISGLWKICFSGPEIALRMIPSRGGNLVFHPLGGRKLIENSSHYLLDNGACAGCKILFPGRCMLESVDGGVPYPWNNCSSRVLPPSSFSRWVLDGSGRKLQVKDHVGPNHFHGCQLSRALRVEEKGSLIMSLRGGGNTSRNFFLP